MLVRVEMVGNDSGGENTFHLRPQLLFHLRAVEIPGRQHVAQRLLAGKIAGAVG